MSKQLHAIVVHIRGSVSRKRAFQELVLEFCPEALHGLRPVMREFIRWNSHLAEVKRALLLKEVRLTTLFLVRG